jgi:hypothetical protein
MQDLPNLPSSTFTAFLARKELLGAAQVFPAWHIPS